MKLKKRNKMETFSKLRPPEAVRIKAKIVEPLAALTSSTTSVSSQCPQQQQQQQSHPLVDNFLSGNVDELLKYDNDRRISSTSQVSSMSSSSSQSGALQQTFRVCDVKKFCVDPQITSFEVLSNLISQAFAIKW